MSGKKLERMGIPIFGITSIRCGTDGDIMAKLSPPLGYVIKHYAMKIYEGIEL
jgi:hypothetical protein